jgi:hypothetical protein
MPKPVYVAWSTTDSFYLFQSERLARSLNLFGLESHIVFKKRPGSWAECCFAKARFILEMMDTFPDRDIIVYLDADAEVKQYPLLLDGIQTDLAFVENGNGVAIASMIYFANNNRCKSFIADWIEANERFPENRAADQENFSDLAHAFEASGGITVTHLPPSYCFEDGITQVKTEPVIMQWIASRIGRMPEFEKTL